MSFDKQWMGNILYVDEEYIKIEGKFEKEICHKFLGNIQIDSISIEYFWFKKGFNVFVFFNPDFSFRNYYCNISSFPTLTNNELSFIDFDIDVIVNDNFEVKILDFDEFQENALKFNYSLDIKRHIDSSLIELLTKIQQREFPFDSLLK